MNPLLAGCAIAAACAATAVWYDTITEPDPNPAASAAATADQGTTTVIITDAIAKGAPAAQAEPAASPVAKTATAQPAASPIPGISQFTQALDPITKAVTSLDSRLAALESRSTGSQRVKSFPASSIQVLDNSAAKFPEFAKFLSAVSGLTPGQKLTKATITATGWSYGLTVTEAQAFITTSSMSPCCSNWCARCRCRRRRTTSTRSVSAATCS